MRKTTIQTTNDAPSTPTVRVFIADDFRQETGGKITAIGLYTDDVVVVTLEPGSPEPSAQTPIIVHNLSALITMAGLAAGKHVVGIQYADSTLVKPPQFGPPREVDVPESRVSAIMVVRFQPFVTGGYGVKHLVVTVDGESTDFGFELRRGGPSSLAQTLPPALGEKGVPLVSGDKRRMVSKKTPSKSVPK